MSSFAPRSFFLQKADGRFYPDFLCQLPDKNNEPGRILAVEYERADRWVAAEDDRLIGCLWANLSEVRSRGSYPKISDNCQ